MNIVSVPGLKTASQRDHAHYAQRARAGYEWVTYQAWNRGKKDYDLAPAKSAGLYASVWGVSYEPESFHSDAKALAEQAVKLGATHYIMDIEMAAKFTRPNRGLQPVVDGARAGGWNGPVHLNTMGPAAGQNDYQIDLQTFLETGGGIFTQAYANETDTFTPELAVAYWTRVGVPKERLNLTISMHPAEADKQYPGRRYDGAKWVELLRAAGWGRAISVFLDEGLTDQDETELRVITLPAPTSPIAENRATALSFLASSVGYWRDDGLPEEKLQRQRQTLAWRVLHVLQTGQNLDAIRAALDMAGAPKP